MKNFFILFVLIIFVWGSAVLAEGQEEEYGDVGSTSSRSPAQKDACPTEDFSPSYYDRICTADDDKDASLQVEHDIITRWEAAKIIVEFLVGTLDRAPDTSVACQFSDISAFDSQTQLYFVTACQLGVMWLQYDGKPDTTFRPTQILTVAEMWTILSRILFGPANNGNAQCRYCNHLSAVAAADIMDGANYISVGMFRELVYVLLDAIRDL